MDTYTFILALIGSIFGLFIVWLVISSLNRYALTVKSKVDKMRSEFEGAKEQIEKALKDAQSKQMSLVRSFASLKRSSSDEITEDEDEGGLLNSTVGSLMAGMGLDPSNPADIQKGVSMLAEKFGAKSEPSGTFL